MKNLKGIIRELVQEVINEMSVTGGGTAGASSVPGDGMNYSAPFTLKNKKHKSGIIVKHLWGK